MGFLGGPTIGVPERCLETICFLMFFDSASAKQLLKKSSVELLTVEASCLILFDLRRSINDIFHE